jgi:glycosyltransferase involved in cell wall biosynthesis
VPEIVEDGLTGFIVNSEAEAVEAIKRLPRLDRAAIRARFEERFSALAMGRRYLEIYERLPYDKAELTEAA